MPSRIPPSKRDAYPGKPGEALLALLRHGPAEEPDAARWPDDDARPLTRAGRKRVRTVARGLRRLGFVPDIVLYSPALRARDTAAIVAEAMGLKPAALTLEPALHADADPAVLVRKTLRARALPARTLWIGHEPGLGEAVGLLTGGAPAPLRKAGVAVIGISGAPSRRGVLRALLPPEWVSAAAKAR